MVAEAPGGDDDVADIVLIFQYHVYCCFVIA